jgi:hypothetical protein
VDDDHVGVVGKARLEAGQPGAEGGLDEVDLPLALFWHSEVVLNCSDQFIVVDVAFCDDDDVFAHVVLVVVLFDHFLGDGLHVGDVSEDGQADLLVLEYAPVRDFDGGFEGLALASFDELAVDGAPLVLDVLPAVERVGEHIAHDLNRLGDILAEDSHHVGSVLARSVRVETAADALH